MTGAALLLLAGIGACSGQQRDEPWDPCNSVCQGAEKIACPEPLCELCRRDLSRPRAERCAAELQARWACALDACEQYGTSGPPAPGCDTESEELTSCRLGLCEPAACSLSPCRCTRQCVELTVEAHCELGQPPAQTGECICLVDGLPERTCIEWPTSACLVEGCCSDYL